MQAQPTTIKNAIWWLDWQLLNWARWMRSDERPEGLPAEACGGITGFAILGDSETVYEAMDCYLAEVTNAAIEGLATLEQMAIYCAYGLARQWNFSYDESTLDRAKLLLLESLIRRGVWMGA